MRERAKEDSWEWSDLMFLKILFALSVCKAFYFYLLYLIINQSKEITELYSWYFCKSFRILSSSFLITMKTFSLELIK